MDGGRHEGRGVFQQQSKVTRFGARIAEAAMIGVVRAVFALARALGPERSAAFGARPRRARSARFCRSTARRSPMSARPSPTRARPRCGPSSGGAWDNIGRIGAEYAHLAVLFDYDEDNPNAGRVEVEGVEHFLALRDDNRPGIIFSAHLANWELPAICAARYGLEATAVFRAPNDPAVAHVVHEVRSQTMGGLEAARQGAAFAMQGVLERGGHLGMLIDQHFTRGVVVDFLGRPAMANPILGKFARQYRLPGARRAGDPSAGRSLPARADPAHRSAARCGRSDQRSGRHAGDDGRGRRLGAGAPRAMAVDAPALARPGHKSGHQVNVTFPCPAFGVDWPQ